MSGRMTLATLGLVGGLAIAAPPFLNAQDMQKLVQNRDEKNQDVRNQVVLNQAVRNEDLNKQPVPGLPSRALGPQLILWSQSERPRRMPLPLPHSSVPPRPSTDAANPNFSTPQTYRKY